MRMNAGRGARAPSTTEPGGGPAGRAVGYGVQVGLRASLMLGTFPAVPGGASWRLPWPLTMGLSIAQSHTGVCALRQVLNTFPSVMLECMGYRFAARRHPRISDPWC